MTTTTFPTATATATDTAADTADRRARTTSRPRSAMATADRTPGASAKRSTRRRHAARKTRVAAVGLSLITTGLLTGAFHNADQASAATTTGTTTYTGAAYSMKWGTTQVKITVSGGKITNVTTVRLPDGKAKSLSLSTRAAAILKTEVLAAQSADVDTVSGATMTSDAYLRSLQSAIDKAVAAGTLSVA